ncbi:hypothetical protein SAMD00019534_055060 [Acytostelium subglobosum LB1]|uniref:hypothetical protein n=1 Tax=Acytostelium subglobosum LB1 TaxID=1410327 RepID=UPI000645040F|nr:hypothetical protein SAMD00019534_055060 [Acytostelium subglobosum LB1]GAM22331.1 hypothetical protein SAMD00019534_055060 [Acytostelium subglobosum LB1]|eukprot:XP_012754451.1 hypothetical protein SAMD00019534_055060 [Acytostelium subglobosum LB1]
MVPVAFYHSLGVFSSVCFGVQYVPQMYLNYSRRSVQGFSLHSIVIKLIGAAFLLVNSALTGESMPIVLYGLLNVLQHSIFMFQFALFSKEPSTSNKTLPWIAFPLIPYLLGNITNSVKPITQLLSHLPQVMVCINAKSTSGVSLPSQYLNLFGGLTGVIMCYGIAPVSKLTYFIFINSVWQALSIFIMYFYYDWRKNKLNKPTEDHNP